MPEGSYTATDYLESIPPNNQDVNITVKITIKNDEIEFDYSGTSLQVDCPVNAPLGVTIAGIYYTLISITNPNIPVNDGCFRPITLKIPEGTVMNPKRPAPVAGGNVETSQRNVDVLMKAFSKVLPHKVPAASQGTMNNITIGGVMSDGAPWTFYETIGGGNGGRPNSDGVDGVRVNMTNTMNTPMEALEMNLPLRFTTYKLRPNSGGPGKYRGGCGIIREWTLTSEKAVLSIMAERNKIKPWGLFGGKKGALGKYVLTRANGKTINLPAKCTIEIFKGDSLTIYTPGGGGYGDPIKRKQELVLKDVLNELVSMESAYKDYKVVINPDTISIDYIKTMILRGSK
jgi:N-methylhydantoinase B